MFTLFSLLVFYFPFRTLMKQVTHQELAFCLRGLGLLFGVQVVYRPLCFPLVDPLRTCIYNTDVLCQQYWTFWLQTFVIPQSVFTTITRPLALCSWPGLPPGVFAVSSAAVLALYHGELAFLSALSASLHAPILPDDGKANAFQGCSLPARQWRMSPYRTRLRSQPLGCLPHRNFVSRIQHTRRRWPCCPEQTSDAEGVHVKGHASTRPVGFPGS